MAILMYFQSERGNVPPLMWLTLLVVVYLTVIELRPLGMTLRLKVWWFSFALLTHFFGYLALRGYTFYQRRAGAE